MRRSHGRSGDAPAAAEDPKVREYRFLLRTAPLDALQVAHHDALQQLSEEQRAAVLTAVRKGLVAGQRLRPSDTAAVARLVTLGERRDPRGFLDACDASALLALADAVIASEPAFGLFGGYAAWDGADPAPADLGVHHDTYVGLEEGQYAGEIKAVEGALIQRNFAGGGGAG